VHQGIANLCEHNAIGLYVFAVGLDSNVFSRRGGNVSHESRKILDRISEGTQPKRSDAKRCFCREALEVAMRLNRFSEE
jgi:hypothetical protein